jgi:hypothetical protein
MLKQVALRSTSPLSDVARAAGGLTTAFPDLSVEARRTRAAAPGPTIAVERGGVVLVPAGRWRAAALDPLELDEAVAHRGSDDLCLQIVDEPGGDLLLTAVQVVTRCQRLLGGRNQHSATPLFDAILARHEALHDRSKPLVAADHDHTLDTWRWVLRLESEASAEVQAAALFHDVERLATESEVRHEQHAANYAAFKDAHARVGGTMAAAALAEAGAPEAFAKRVAELVATHERPGDDPEKTLLNEADALSFFSLNAPGFARYYGPAHTAKKVAYTLARLGPRGRAALAGIRHRADIAALIEAAA